MLEFTIYQLPVPLILIALLRVDLINVVYLVFIRSSMILQFLNDVVNGIE